MFSRLCEQEILASFDEALRKGYIFPVYQLQVNHRSHRIIGAEALMRWNDPVAGMQYPLDFIPVLETHNLISKADLHIFKEVCLFQKRCLALGVPPIPISVNVSRFDIFEHADYVDELEDIRRGCAIPVSLLRVELTESSSAGSADLLADVLTRLHNYGYLVELDDFGSGYSSLNVLKDLHFDLIKLDMRFLDGHIGGRGGIIVSSIVQMAKWLETPVVVEGVETIEQADYMGSLGSDYVQGYLYSKPIDARLFLEQLQTNAVEPVQQKKNLVRTIDTGRFWDPDSLETFLFSKLAGPAALFTYVDGNVEILRVNEKYLAEIGLSYPEEDVISKNPWMNHTRKSRKLYEATMRKAILSGQEECCENWRFFRSPTGKREHVCIKSAIRVLGMAGPKYVIYALIRNVTAEKKAAKLLHRKQKDHVFYRWTYLPSTKRAYLSSDAVRNLGLPMVLENFPEPFIESHVIPKEHASMFRDWHVKLAEGIRTLSAIIPLTAQRIPFHISYDLHLDPNGLPIRAYGHAKRAH